MENSKKVSLVGTVLFTVCSILVLDSFVAPAIIGVSSITVWIISAIIFFIPLRSPVRRARQHLPG